MFQPTGSPERSNPNQDSNIPQTQLADSTPRGKSHFAQEISGSFQARLNHFREASGATCDKIELRKSNDYFPYIPAQDDLRIDSQELRGSNSLTEFREAYQRAGYEFKNNEELVDAIRQDWLRLSELYTCIGALTPLPTYLPAVRVEKNGVSYHIHGVIHCRRMGREYIDMVNRTIKDSQLCFLEQNLHTLFKAGKNDNVTEVQDHLLMTPTEEFLLYYKTLGALAVYPLAKAYSLLAPGKWKSSALRRAMSLPANLQLKDQFPTNKRLRIKAKIPSELSHKEIPAAVELDMKRNNCEELNSVQRRSAYQALLTQHYAEATGKTSVHLVVGGYHVPEIKYFLLNGVENGALKDRIEKHGNILSIGRDVYYDYTTWKKRQRDLVPLAGTFCGLASSYGIVQLVHHSANWLINLLDKI